MRWVMLGIPESDLDRMMFGTKPYVLYEAPKGAFVEIRGATIQEVGMYGYKQLPLSPVALA